VKKAHATGKIHGMGEGKERKGEEKRREEGREEKPRIGCPQAPYLIATPYIACGDAS